MNAFADWLFGLILGWTRTLANSVMNLFAKSGDGISGVFPRIWLPVLLVLLAAGTAADIAVWFFRWRPDRAWRSRMLGRRLDRQNEADSWALETLDMPQEDLAVVGSWASEREGPVPGWNAVLPPVPGQPRDDAAFPFFAAQPDGMSETSPRPVGGDGGDFYLPWDDAASPADVPPPRHLLLDAAAYEIDGGEAPVQNALPGDGQALAQPAGNAALPVRRRRSDMRKRDGSGLKRAVVMLKEGFARDEDEEAMLDGLPPPVPQSDAFLEPIYPHQYKYRDRPQEK